MDGINDIHNALTHTFPVIEVDESSHPMRNGIYKGPELCPCRHKGRTNIVIIHWKPGEIGPYMTKWGTGLRYQKINKIERYKDKRTGVRV